MPSRVAPTPPLLPRPRHYRSHNGRLRLRDGMPIVLAPASGDADFASAVALRDELLRRTDLHLPVETHGRRDGIAPAIELVRTGDVGDAYRIEVAIPTGCLNGFDPLEHPRIGIFYKIKDTQLGEQFLYASDELGWNSDPSIWATGVLTR